jgi:hypothetical protein
MGRSDSFGLLLVCFFIYEQELAPGFSLILAFTVIVNEETDERVLLGGKTIFLLLLQTLVDYLL